MHGAASAILLYYPRVVRRGLNKAHRDGREVGMRRAGWLLAAGAIVVTQARGAEQGLDPGAQLPLAESHETAELTPTHLRRL